MKSLNSCNLTNLYTKTNVINISNDFKQIIEQSRDGVFGIEVMANKGATNFTLVSPSFIKRNGKLKSSNQNQLMAVASVYEGYLYEPFFLPLCTDFDGELIKRLQSLAFILNDHESIFIQWLFKKASYNWQDKAIQMYSSYILGNDQPLTSSFGRRIQDRMIHLMRRFGTSSEVRDYINEAEQKIISEGYCFKLNIIIDSSTERRKQIISSLEGLFNQYTYFNAIKISKVKGKNLQQQINNCVMTPDTKYQILSVQEILSLFGGNNGFIIEEKIIDTSNQNEFQFVKNVIELLPDYPLQKVSSREGLTHAVEEALKRVGITNQARVYNAIVTTGIRLTVLQFDIPKDKNLTDITKKQTDIRAALGVTNLSIEQGDAADTVRMLIPNEQQTIVGLRALLEVEPFKEFSKKNKLSFVVGVNEINEPINLSLAKLPHLLVTGTTGSGKSVFINQMAITLMLTNSPKELQMIMIDPKMVEFQHYEDFPHVQELVSEMDRVEELLDELTKQMDKRYTIFKDVGVKNISLYNDKVQNKELKDTEIMPYIVCIIDEYADLKDTNPEIENYVARLTQKSRAAGIHLVLCTQRPSSNIISGKIKANVPNAISFNLSNSNNYKTVFGTGIPYTLLGNGDGVMKIEGWGKEFQRFQSPILSPDEKIEFQVYQSLAKYLNKQYAYSTTSKDEKTETVSEQNEGDNEDESLYKLKQIIADTKETRSTELRRYMGIKNLKLTDLMKKLVAEGFLEIGRTKQEGYKINEAKLNEWISKNQ
ncbi:FtsK/SpoIIIE domain-containing protein [Solibacillus sp. FSL H8-0523]|uniref:FtsK/SpoIIIE domain-containing protein n=1 Tax=Solibacillus sp. FSL H8-0523 TaxID=2954511 RepID=UPI0031012D0E